MKKLIVVMIMLVGFSTVGFASPKPYTMIQEHYMVVQGDTLDSIASNHIIKNTYGVNQQFLKTVQNRINLLFFLNCYS